MQEGGDRGSAADREEQGDAQSADSAVCRGGETEGGDDEAQGERSSAAGQEMRLYLQYMYMWMFVPRQIHGIANL